MIIHLYGLSIYKFGWLILFLFFCIKMSFWQSFRSHVKCEGKRHTYRHLSIPLFFIIQKNYTVLHLLLMGT